MATAVIDNEQKEAEVSQRPPVVNDFSIVAATVNGSGSQTANGVLIRAMFKMGIPVSGKNLFPSNISGLPTWYTIRLSKDGYIARREKTEILIALNPATADDDLAAMPSGGVCIYPNDLKFREKREDVIYYDIPLKELVKNSGADAKLRDYVANMAYVGAVAELFGIELDEIKSALNYHFNNKAKAVELNYNMVIAAAEWVRENHPKRDPYHVERMNGTEGLILIDGNTAGALGAVFGGVTFVAWYPITPATSLADGLSEYLPKLRKDKESGNATYSMIQAEDELAAIGMVLGAGWAGARAMTSTSGPGISLMTEFAGYGFFAEIPGVIWDIMRMGPSTGLPTRVAQGDVMKAYYLGHGDTRHVCLLPGSVAECFEFGWRAFDLADRIQTPVFVLSDLDLGMNNWMSAPFEYPTESMDRGKVLTADDLKEMDHFGRYEDVDGDGIAYRTLPGNTHPNAAYFNRGTGHNAQAVYSERADDWQENMTRLYKKHDTARGLVPTPVLDEVDGAKIGIIAYGSADPAIREARDLLHAQGIETSYLRVRALPLETKMSDFLAKYDRIYVVELNHEGQMAQMVRLHEPTYAGKIISVAHCDGLPLTANFVAGVLAKQESK